MKGRDAAKGVRREEDTERPRHVERQVGRRGDTAEPQHGNTAPRQHGRLASVEEKQLTF
jgi:hypothetical protein